MNDSAREPFVVIVDDEPDNVQGLAADLHKTLAVQVLEPQELDEPALREGTIFLVDLFLTDWPGREELTPGAQVFDGVALAAVIRAHARNARRPPPIIALNTGHAGDFSDLPVEIREHAIARANNLEWVFLKNDSRSSIPTHERVAELAEAQRRLPRDWREAAAETDLLELLGARESELDEILDAWPPIREVNTDTAGVAMLRWLLHRVLPYPCFLLDERHVAVRLGLSCSALNAAAEGGSKLAEALSRCSYKGVLAGFDGPRWWRSRIEEMLWELSPSRDLPTTVAALQALSDVPLERTETPNGVVVLDADYTPRPEPADVAEAVRIRLDDWPPYAEDAWASIDDAREDPRLRDRVLPLDRARLDV
ncbi:MAG: hypothetical protein WD844_01395 [Thermoleophilaceae bacterium]